MSNLFQIQNATKSFGMKQLFQGASFAVNEGEHIGVIGPNGAGKTTLFKVLTDQEQLDSGDVVRAKGLRVGYLAQHDAWNPQDTVETYLSTGCITPIWELKSLGRGLGLTLDIFEKPIASLSGGYRMRCKLLHLLGEEPDVLLLDEPTNYLDLESLLVLERFLQDYKRAFLLISHDREFLRRTTDHIVEVEEGDITKYNGSLDDYFEQKALLRTQLEARAMSLEEKRKSVLDFVARFGAKATKAKQAQSRLKSLDRMETIEIKALPQTAVINIPEPLHTGKRILTLEQVNLGYGERIVLQNVNFYVDRGDHLAVVGVNGAGKSTFLKALAQKLVPLKGEVKLGYEVGIGYYAQHVAEALDPKHSVLEAMGAKAHRSVTQQEILNLAGALLFSGDDTKKPVSVLSGGEKSRVALGQILLQKAPCLLLDEPTNHLDFQTVEALTQALSRYAGTLIVVSHDRSFIRRIANKILEIRDGRVDYYPGTYDEYVWSCQKGVLAERDGDSVSSPAAATAAAATPAKSVAPSAPERKFNYKEEKRTLERDVRRLQKEIGELETKTQGHQDRMKGLNENLITHGKHPDLHKWITELGNLQLELSAMEERWLTAQSELENTLQAIAKLTGADAAYSE